MQVLVYHDLLGMIQHPHHAKVTPRFCKQYARVGAAIQDALQTYNEEVKARGFPSAQYAPYSLAEGEDELLIQELEGAGMQPAAQAVREARASAALSN